MNHQASETTLHQLPVQHKVSR